jgi:hypothetical protein
MVEYYQRSWPPHVEASFLYEVKLQNNDQLNKQVTGTYVPKELILDIASWISVEFYSVAYGDVRSPPCGTTL